jgi:hypothetical protein
MCKKRKISLHIQKLFPPLRRHQILLQDAVVQVANKKRKIPPGSFSRHILTSSGPPAGRRSRGSKNKCLPQSATKSGKSGGGYMSYERRRIHVI